MSPIAALAHCALTGILIHDPSPVFGYASKYASTPENSGFPLFLAENQGEKVAVTKNAHTHTHTDTHVNTALTNVSERRLLLADSKHGKTDIY